MLFTAFRSLGIHFLTISIIVICCFCIVWIAEGRESADELLHTSISGMNGIMVWTFGYGLSLFVSRRGRILPIDLIGILENNSIINLVVSKIERSTKHRHAIRYTIPVTLIGIFLTSVYGIPNNGIGKIFIFIGVCSIYYIASFTLFHFIEFTLAFNYLYKNMDRVNFKKVYSPIHLENLTSYLAITTALGLCAIYSGFRGTLTAGFRFENELWKTFLFTPLFLFLPGTLLYNYYPRYVLKKILQYKAFSVMERLGDSDEINARELILSLRETASLNSQILPFLDYKSLPSYLIAVIFAISIAYNSDPAVTKFIDYILNM